jgi:hypothetical protein
MKVKTMLVNLSEKEMRFFVSAYFEEIMDIYHEWNTQSAQIRAWSFPCASRIQWDNNKYQWNFRVFGELNYPRNVDIIIINSAIYEMAENYSEGVQ